MWPVTDGVARANKERVPKSWDLPTDWGLAAVATDETGSAWQFSPHCSSLGPAKSMVVSIRNESKKTFLILLVFSHH